MRSSRLRAFLLALLALPVAAHAQGTLSTQGFGYPGGQLSTRSLGAGGAMGESDPFSATNPAALYNFGGSVLYFQAEPEYRTTKLGNQSESATIARYPLITAAVPLGPRFMAGLTASNLLDRSFLTSVRAQQTVGSELVTSTNTFKSDGAIADVRLGLAWAPTTWMHLGVGGHVITGDNKLNSTQAFDDTVRYATLVDTQTVTYTGTAYSAGFDIMAGDVMTFSGSYLKGGPLSIKRADTTLRTAHVPDRLSLGAAFVGIRGTTIGVRTSRNTWSNMASLSANSLKIADAWDSSIGADVLGPRVFGSAVQLRAGARTRTLPFGTPALPLPGDGIGQGADVKETSFSFGAGAGLARGRASLDLAAIRASRSAANTALAEHAWTLSVGISVRP